MSLLFLFSAITIAAVAVVDDVTVAANVAVLAVRCYCITFADC